MKRIYITLSFLLSLLVLTCSGGGDDSPGPDPDPDPDPITPPTAANLVFPLEDSECNEGENFTPTQSDVTFDWSDAANTTSYQLNLKNLDTQNTTQHTSSISELTLTISRSTPYSWFVVSRNSGTVTATSDTWKFYNAGESETSYAPFPTELIAPEIGANLNASTTTVNLQWECSDVDNDIDSYTVLFGTASTPSATEASNITNNTLNVTVNSNTTYYWRVITTDAASNNSESEIFQFKVN